MSHVPEPGAPMLPADADVRRRAIETLDRPLLIEAGAGTGKTTVLIDRLLHAIACGHVRAPAIVAITFTEKAAAELRLRLRQELELRAAAADATDAAGLRLRRAVTELHEARISTIHAFASTLLREHPVEAHLDPRFRMLDELESMQLQNAFWSRWIDSQLDDDTAAPLLRALVTSGVQLEPDVRALARALYENRDVAAVVQRPLAPVDMGPRLRALRDAMLVCVRHAEQACVDQSDKGYEHLRALAARLQALEDLDPESWPAVFLTELEMKPRLGRRDAWRPGQADASKEMRQRLQVALDDINQELANGVLRAGLVWVERYLAAYAGEKRQIGVLDFQDLLLLARALVGENLAVRRELSDGIGMLCVDEFQDTDPLQAEIAVFLAEGSGRAARWTDVQLGPKLFLVGDPKQSIYRFRRADLDVYARCRELVLASGGMALDIVQNFRSRPAVVQWVNATFSTLFGPDAEDPSAPRHVDLVPAPECLQHPGVWIVRGATPESDGEGAADAARRAEADALARFVHAAIQAGWPVRDGAARRALRAGDIAILFGRTSGIEIYEEALRGAGLPFRQEGGKLFFQRQEVRDVLHALAACDDPLDELSIVAALRSTLFGISDVELWQHRARHASFDYRIELPAGAPLAAAFATLASLHAERQGRGVAATIESLLARTHQRAVCAARAHGERVWSNLEMLVRQARAFEVARPVGLREFVRSFRELDEDPPKLAEWVPDQEGSEHLRLLTVHMAKGLEFPCVVLANLGGRASTQSPNVLYDRTSGVTEFRLRAGDALCTFATAGYEVAARRERARDRSEDRRLLYVAATRARDYLVLGAFGAKPDGYLEMLQGVPGALGGAAFGPLGDPAAGDHWLRPGAGEAVPAWCVLDAARLPAVTRTALPAPPADVDARLRERREWSAQHAARIAAGAGFDVANAQVAAIGMGSERNPVVAEAAPEETRVCPDAHRVGVLTHRALAAGFAPASPPTPRLPTDVPPVVVASSVLASSVSASSAASDDARLDDLVHRVLARHQGLDLETEIRGLVGNAAAWELRRLGPGVQRIWRDVRWIARVGSRLFDEVLDLVFEENGGLVVVDYTLRDRSSCSAVSAAADHERRRLAVSATGIPVREVGTFFLRTGDYIALTED